LNAVNNVNTTLKSNIENKEFSDFVELDNFMIELDGTKNKSKL
jgi:enolase